MALTENTFENLGLSLGGKLLYCSNSIGLDVSVSELETSCLRSGSNKTYKPGGIDITAKADGVMTTASGADAAANVTSENLLDMTLAKTVMDITFGSTEPGGASYEGSAFITSFSNTAAFGEVGSYSIALRINGPLEKTVNPTV